MKALGVNTSTEILTVSARTEKGRFSLSRDIDLRHAEQILPLIEYVLAQLSISIDELDLFVAARGPGSFTGLRIGMATIKGLAAGTGKPYISVPTLDVYASRFSAARNLVTAPIIDAKKNRFYTALYEGSVRRTDYLDVDPDNFRRLTENLGPIVLTGPHASMAKSRLPEEKYLLDPNGEAGSGEILLRLGMERFIETGAEDIGAGPFYIRHSEAEMKLEERENGRGTR